MKTWSHCMGTAGKLHYVTVSLQMMRLETNDRFRKERTNKEKTQKVGLVHIKYVL